MGFMRFGQNARFLIVVVTALVGLLISRVSAGKLIIYKIGSNDIWQRVYTGPAQRCYTYPCFLHETNAIGWDYMQTSAWIVFFSEPGCQGNYLKLNTTKNDFLLNPQRLNYTLASMMLWESSIYPTRGFEDVCWVKGD